MTRPLDLIGLKFNRLTVKQRVENGSSGQSRWLCECECGNESIVGGTQLNQGKTKSCGCLTKEKIGALNKSHGQTIGRKTTKTFNSYRGMKARCYDPNNSHYIHYGGRGIQVLEPWYSSFEEFFKDMGERPEGMSLERIDINGPYCKENCKWENSTNQAFNIKKKSNNTSGRSGVKRSKNGQKWIAMIGKNGKKHYLGTFDTYEEAVEVREKAELEMYGFIKNE